MAFGNLDSDDDGSPLAEINVTPLVDIMLVLLITFMITMPVLTHSIPLKLPVVATQDHVQSSEPLRLSIGKDGEYALGSNKVSLEELTGDLKSEISKNPEAVLAIAADKEVSYDFVAKALAAAREAGFSKVGFITEQPSEQS